MGSEGRRYRAFISYSHKDRVAGDQLFKRLDGYRPPKALRGHETPFGPVPARLYPVFRDREELTSSPDLPAHIENALDASDHLVVLCSPDAAASRWVNEEVATFRRLGKGDRIHPVLTAGEPAAAFPPVLTQGAEEPLAADLRPSGDGWTDGPLKVIAGLLGISFGELKDREVARARARARVYAAIALAFAILAVVAGISAWRAIEQTRLAEAQLDRAEAAILTAVEGVARIIEQVGAGVERGSIPTALAKSLLATADGLISGVVRLAPDNQRLLMEQGKVLLLFAVHYQAVGDLKSAKAAAARARKLFAGLETRPESALTARSMRAAAVLHYAESLVAAGDRAGALDAYQESLEIFRQLAASDAGNGVVARTVSAGASASLEGLRQCAAGGR